MIPKKIHYCWFGGNPLDELTKKCIASWKKYCPDYEIIEWNEDNFDIYSCPQYVQQAFESKKWAFLTDYIRLKVVYENGGIYFDTDVELLKNIDSLLKHKAWFGFENDKYVNTGLGFGAEQHNHILKRIISQYQNIPFILPDGSFDLTTCPTRNISVFLEYGLVQNNTTQVLDNDIVVFSSDFLCPIEYETGKKNFTNNTISIHHFNASWHNDFEKILHNKKRIFIEKYGVEGGKEKYNLWLQRNKYFLYIKQNGIVKTFFTFIRKAIKTIVSLGVKLFLGNNMIALESLNGFDGNSGAVYNYMVNKKRYRKYKFVWFVKDKNLYLEKANHRTFIFDNKGSIFNRYFSYFLLNNCKYILYDDVPIMKTNSTQKSIYLTHGCPPIKNVEGVIVVPDETDKVLCTSNKLKYIISKQFGADINKVFFCGLPRNDELFVSKNELSKLIKKKNEKIIMWMPTFRKFKNGNRNDSNAVFEMGIPLIQNEKYLEEVNDYLKEKSCKLIVKIHPGQDLSVVKKITKSNIILLSQSDIINKEISLYALLGETDALLTDYSSVAFDYMFLNKPIGYIIDDINEYKLGFAFDDVYKYMPGNKIKTIEDLLLFIDDISSQRDNFEKERNKILKITNDYPDNQNTKRLIDLLEF